MRSKRYDPKKDLLYNMGKISFDTYIYKTDLLKKEKIQFDEDLKYGEDREFNWKYLANCKSTVRVDEMLYFYRPNEHSATKKKATWRNTDALISVDRTYKYLKEKGCSFADEYYKYMYARNMWHVAKNFAVSRDKILFNRLTREYNVKACMKITKNDSNLLVRISSLLFILSPKLFFTLVGLWR